MLKVIIGILWAYLICLLLTIGVTATIQAQGAGSAVDLDGNNDYVNCGDNASLYPTVSVTVEAWFKHTGENGYIFSNWWGGGFRGINLGVYPSRNLRFTIGNNTSGQDSADAGSKYNDGIWHHVAGVYDKANLRLKIFIDGILKQNKSTSITSIAYGSNYSDYVTLGAVENGQVFWWG
ncbi:LamG domain-containing protein [bacterium]|nr:LamG domain-containing protein [bacterium]